jgi:hypothetical protein
MFRPVGLLLLLPAVLLTQDTSSQSISDKDNHHWQKLEKVCESRCPVNGKPVTYGINEFVEGKDGNCFKICKWSLVPYWPGSRG